jgi:hypothetical protein
MQHFGDFKNDFICFCNNKVSLKKKNDDVEVPKHPADPPPPNRI